MKRRISKFTIITIITCIALLGSSFGVFAANEEGEDSRSPSMSVESGEEPIEDETVTQDDGPQEEEDEVLVQSDEEETSIQENSGNSEIAKESKPEDKTLFGLSKRIVVLGGAIIAVGVIFLLLVVIIESGKRRHRLRKGKRKR